MNSLSRLSRLSRLSLPYAETHYKFKLPWSPLYRPWPEIFLDGPSFCVPGMEPVFYLVAKDADFFPVSIRQVEILIKTDSGMTRKQTVPLDFHPRENLVFHPLPLDFRGLTGMVSLTGKITVENKRGAKREYINTNFPGILPEPLRIHFLSSPLPYPENWHAGEMHCHSEYSNDPVEYGAPLRVLQQAGSSLGLGFVLCTDHSYDFYYRRTRYMERVDPDANFREYRREALELNHPSKLLAGHPVIIPGEEVSCGNDKGENVHLLVAGHEAFLPGLGDGGRRWFNNRPDLSIGQVLERLGDTPCFSAHPRSRVGTLERLIFRRGRWNSEDIVPAGTRGVNGLQFWNGHRGTDFREGRDFWVNQLLAGNRLFPIGANDAHGDLNQNIGVKTPLISLYQNRNHVFGHVRTVVHAESKTLAGIQNGLREGPLFCTDGPAIMTALEGGSLRILAKSNLDYKGIASIQVLSGTQGDTREVRIKEWKFADPGPLDFSESIPTPRPNGYIRAEVSTQAKKFALSSPLYL